MKITLISFDNWGFNQHIAKALEHNNHKVNHIDFSKFKYKYPTFLHRLYNFFLKILFKKNLKTKFYGNCIIDELKKNNEPQDLILTIKGDFIAPEFAIQIKNYTKKSVAFFNDNTKRCPKIIRVLPCFDEVFSFEKEDCKKYNLKFKTNFIYNYEENVNFEKKSDFEVFNISSYGKRSDLIIKIAEKLSLLEIPYKFYIFDKKKKIINNSLINSIQETIPLSVVNKYIEKSNVLLDIHRENQNGLSFRVFESMGLHKKLITTNSDIKNYDFYNPNNILIIDKKKPNINETFFDQEYEPIADSIFKKYTLDGWIENVIFNNLQ